MHLKHSMMPVTTSSDLSLVNNGEKHGIENYNHLFFLLAHTQVQKGPGVLKDSQRSCKIVLNANFCKILIRIYLFLVPDEC